MGSAFFWYIVSAEEFTPGSGTWDGEDEESEEDCSDAETLDSLGELVFPDETSHDPVCTSVPDQNLMNLAKQFLEAKKGQCLLEKGKTGEALDVAKPRDSNTAQPPKPASTALPSFVTRLGIKISRSCRLGLFSFCFSITGLALPFHPLGAKFQKHHA